MAARFLTPAVRTWGSPVRGFAVTTLRQLRAAAANLIAFALLAIGALPALAPSAHAHPHVWIDAVAALIVSEGQVVAIRHGWRFDADYVRSMTAQYDTNKDGRISPEEMAPLDALNRNALKEFKYFTDVRAGAKKVAADGPHDYRMRYVGDRLAVQFEVRLASPVPLGEFKLEIYDQTFFSVYTFVPENPIQIEGAVPSDCKPMLEPSPPASEHQKFLKLFRLQMGSAALKGVNVGAPRTVSIQCQDPTRPDTTASAAAR